jgi:hypothetical protein
MRTGSVRVNYRDSKITEGGNRTWEGDSDQTFQYRLRCGLRQIV